MFLPGLFAPAIFEFVCLCEAWRPTETFRRSRHDQTFVCQQPSLMFETCECKHTPTRGGTMHASLQTANKRGAASLVVAHRLNFPTRKRASAFVLHMFAIEIVCSVMLRFFLSRCENLTPHSLDDSTGAEKARERMFCKLLPEGMAASDR